MDLCGRVEEKASLLTLPAEIRATILDHVFEDDAPTAAFTNQKTIDGTQTTVLQAEYRVSSKMAPLSVCRLLYREASLLALSRTTFVASSLFCNIPHRLRVLCPQQTGALRSIAFVADARHFGKLLAWGEHPFGVPELRLDTVTIVLHRSSYFHYLYDFTADIAKLLRRLGNVKRLVFVRNDARVKGSFLGWYNRLVARILKTDHYERFDASPPNPEERWWRWSFDHQGQTCCLSVGPPKPAMVEEEYMEWLKPLHLELMASVENEPYNADPRVRNGA
ncbi:hypothetical protein MBLNU230_g3079t1 [Neophaeotheca triangularis]